MTAPRKAPSQERSRATFEAILEAAAQVFERHGYAAGTTNRIAERAGVSIGSLYQYFPNKDAILAALAERHLEEGRRVFAPVLARLDGSRPVTEAIGELVGALIELHRHQPGMHRVLSEEVPGAVEIRARFVKAASRTLAAYLRQRPEVIVNDPDLAAHMVIQIAESITHTTVIHPTPTTPVDKVADETLDVLTRYLTRQ